MKQVFLFAEENRLQKLSALGDCLERLKIIDWESFRPIIALSLIRERKSNAGRRSFDSVMLFKTIVLQRLYNLSDDQTEFQINDRMSFMRFLGISLDDKVPDESVWNNEALEELACALEKLPQTERNVIILIYYHGKPKTEVAKILDITYGQLRYLHDKALSRLKETLSRHLSSN